MKNPSPQFIGKLENELRSAYRAQYQPARKPLGNFFKFFLPALSGALVLGMVLLNFGGNIFSNNNQQTSADNNSSDSRLAAFNDGADEEQLAKDFDNDELTQIDNNVRLVSLSNF